MNCEQFQKLMDVHLDGDLVGTLRVEFDAHRVHCPACRHAITLLEAVTNVAAEHRAPATTLPSDFTDRVLSQIAAQAGERRQEVTAGRRGLRTALAIGALIQAAAVWMFVIWPQNSNRIPISTPPEQIDVARVTPDALKQYVYELAAHRMELAGALGQEVAQLRQMAMNLNVSDSIALDPVGLLQAWLPVLPDTSTTKPAPDRFSF